MSLFSRLGLDNASSNVGHPVVCLTGGMIRVVWHIVYRYYNHIVKVDNMVEYFATESGQDIVTISDYIAAILGVFYNI